MSSEFKLPSKKSVLFWPVGTGDSTTLVLKPDALIMQIDLRHLEKADDPEEPEWNIIDYLVKALPKKDGRPYLALFVLTHPDKDHIQGFAEFLKKVEIGELWHTPKIFRDQSDQDAMCEDAKAFRKEAHRRRDAIIASPNNIKSGNRLRVIGHDDVLLEDQYKDLPDECKSRPAEMVSFVDGIDLTGHFQAFIHAPFKDDQAKNKNNTSLSLNIVIQEGAKYGQFFFFGDREYPTTKRIFETTEAKGNTGYLAWNVVLCPHHCSKAVMHWQEDADEEETFKQDIMTLFEKYSRDKNGYIISSSHAHFTDEEGDLPPHGKARKRYEAIVKAGRFLCTHEYPSKKEPAPIVFFIDEDGFGFDDKRPKSQGPSGLAATVATAGGAAQPPSVQVGFGIIV
jgi:beta-lactamase superfamily II metal-dependent hydrolase